MSGAKEKSTPLRLNERTCEEATAPGGLVQITSSDHFKVAGTSATPNLHNILDSDENPEPRNVIIVPPNEAPKLGWIDSMIGIS